MKQLFFTTLLFFIPFIVFGQQQRLIVYDSGAWFPFEPLSGRYAKGSLAQLEGYIEAWGEELDPKNVSVHRLDSYLDRMPEGYRAYLAASGDSAMLNNIEAGLGRKEMNVERFELSNHLVDTLGEGRILVIDRWEMFGDVDIKAKIVDISDFPVSKDFMQANDRNIEIVKRRMATPLLSLDTIYTTRDCYFGTSHLAGLFHAYQLEVSSSDLSLFAPPRFDMSWQAGELYLKDIYRMLVYDNELMKIEASGAQVLEFLEEVYGGRYYTLKRSSDDLVRSKTPYFYHESLAGASYSVNVSKPKGSRIENHNIDPAKTYTVAINSFRSKWFQEKGCKTVSAGKYRPLFIQWLAKQTNLKEFKQVETWKLTPERPVAEATMREKQSLFDK